MTKPIGSPEATHQGESIQPSREKLPVMERCLIILKQLGLAIALALASVFVFPVLYVKGAHKTHSFTKLFLTTLGFPYKEKLVGYDRDPLYQPFNGNDTDKKEITSDGQTITICDELFKDADRNHFTVNGVHSLQGDQLLEVIPELKSHLSDEEILHLSPSLQQRTRNSLMGWIIENYGMNFTASANTDYPDVEVFIQHSKIIILHHLSTRQSDENNPTITTGYRAASSVVVLDREKLKRGAADAAEIEQIIYHGFTPYYHEQENNVRPKAEGVICDQFMQKAIAGEYLPSMGIFLQDKGQAQGLRP